MYVCLCSVYICVVYACVYVCLCVCICVTKDFQGYGGYRKRRCPFSQATTDGRRKVAEKSCDSLSASQWEIYNNRIKRFNSVLPFFTRNNQTAAVLFGLFKFWRYLTDPDHWRFAYCTPIVLEEYYTAAAVGNWQHITVH